jgi:hypothetical protein
MMRLPFRRVVFIVGVGLVVALALLLTPRPANAPDWENASPDLPAPINTAWGETRYVQPTQHWQVPVLWQNDGSILMVWAGADEQEARLYSAHLQSEDTMPNITGTILALKAYYPQDIRIAPARTGTYHLLWRDAENDGDTLRLRSAIIQEDGIATVGALTLSDATTQDYALLAQGDEAHVAYVVGEWGNTVLYGRTIDANGRLAFAQRLAVDAEQVALVAYGEQKHLFWTQNGALWRGVWNETGLTDVQRWGQIILPDDYSYNDVHVAVNGQYFVVWLDVRDANGQARIWWASASYDAERLPLLSVLHFTRQDASFNTGYNTGDAQVIRPHDEGAVLVQTMSAVTRQESILPTVITFDEGEMGVLYWHEGEPVGYQAIVQSPILGKAHIVTDTQRHLSVVWQSIEANTPIFALTSTLIGR